jgi:predicted restriction endonuclease
MAIVRRELEYNSSDSESYQGRYDLFYSVNGIGEGVWGLRESLALTPTACDFVAPTDRAVTTTYRILRDTALARRIKKLYGNPCQICGEVLRLADDESYSEAHHVQPLGSPHDGPDTAENILVLCPNHHALCDLGALKLSTEEIRSVAGHRVGEEYIEYHNQTILKTTTARNAV